MIADLSRASRLARSLRLWVAAGFVLVALAIVVHWSHARATAYFYGELRERGSNTLRLAESTLRGQLSRFERLPGLIAEQPAIRSLVLAPRDPSLVEAANYYLRDITTILGASDIYVMFRDGETLAASNFDRDTSFVGGNFAFRPYFHDALAAGEGRFFALGTTSNKRGYYFGAPIEVAGQRAGVLVIKIDVDEIEQTWANDDDVILVTDPEEIVFLSNRSNWLYRSFGPLSEDRLVRTLQTRRYANAEIGELTIRRDRENDAYRVIGVQDHDGNSGEYLVLSTLMPDAEWNVKVLTNTRPAQVQALIIVAAGLLALGVVMLSAYVVWQRRAALAERLVLQHQARSELERRVTERTSQLARANALLEAEIAERRTTEDRLRQTQEELVQAGKLAALGQMSAALSHEFNQPLAAARNYAENADLLLERDRKDEARSNIGHILGMIDRMGRISRHLRTFARKPNQQLIAVALSDAINGAQEVISWRFERSEAELLVEIGPVPLFVTVGPVRLQQVLVNLIGNALDAVQESVDKRLHLNAVRHGGQVTLTLRDHGPGVPESIQARIFDPFFSTKGIGHGLGLGLSISYNIVHDFGGQLTMRNHPEGGAEFSLTLRAANAPREIAAAE